MLTSSDNFKIRRLILDKLFRAWHGEAHRSRLRAAKAAQIISRMIRRSRGPIWMKESQLVCFHMWRRYTGVKNAYRSNKPDPVYGYPYFPQWNKLIKAMINDRTRKKRIAAIGEILQVKLWLNRWRKAQENIKNIEFMTDEMIATKHYHKKLCSNILFAWYHLVRMKGKAVRYRNKIFFSWQAWAPYKHLMSMKKKRISFWMDMRRQRKYFDEMIKLCQQSIYRLVDTLRKIRQNQQNRKLLVCTYGLLDKSEHMTFLDCWRRWKMHQRCQNNWRNSLFQCRYGWYQARNRGEIVIYLLFMDRGGVFPMIF